MKDLIDTLLDCPNLSLRLLDASTGRTVKILTGEQLRQFARPERSSCAAECDNDACPNRPETDKF